MAINKEFVGQGLGKKMLLFAIKIALRLNRIVGCRFLTLEAKNAPDLPEEEKPIHFYKNNSFETLKERKENAAYIPMYKDLKTIIDQVEKTKLANILNDF